ncbi:MAG: extracellular solute-binding protein [Acidobacteria bacterium]|nr:extracellular solute-binding protein [Acidobacteriota bacterium]
MSGRNDLRIGQSPWVRVLFFAGLLFLLTPLVLLILFSFNASKNVTQWGGFSVEWYGKAFRDTSLWISVRNSLLVAVLSTLISTVLGTLAALAIGARRFRGRALLRNLVHIPIILPEIVFGVALLILFMVIRLPLGLLSVTCAHVTFSLSFVIIIVLTSVLNFDREIEHAALDLGARPVRAFFDVVLPNISAGIVSAALFAFALSIDDFVVTFFTTGAGFTTFPLKVYSMLKYGINPSINAVSTLLILVTCAAVAGGGLLALKRDRLEGKLRWVTGGLLTLTAGLVAFLCLAAPRHKVIHFANYSEYFDESILEDFRKETGIEVVMDYFGDVNELLTKLDTGTCSEDLMMVSDHFVEIMIKQGHLRPLDFGNIPNARYLDPGFRALSFDPSGRYYVPYAWGLVAIAYNADKVREPVDSWKVFWDPAYRERMTFVAEMRPVFAVAYLLLGYSINDTDPAHLARAKALLLKQKPLLRKYESALFKDMLRSGEIWLAQVWSGEGVKLCREDPKRFRLAFPREGCQMFVDNFCIPGSSKNAREVEIFINYLLRPEVSARNMNFICYAMPNPEAFKLLPPDLRDHPTLFAPGGGFGKYPLFHDVGRFLDPLTKAWTEIRGH